MTLLLALSLSAQAQDGYYDTTSIAMASEVFTEANALQTQYAEVSGRSGAIATALNEYQTALDLLGPAAPEGQQEHLDDLARRFAREQATLQAFVDTLITDFDGTFTAAMERAIAAHDGTATECEGRVAVGRQLPGMPARTEANPDCEGEDLNATLAAAMDADPELRPAVVSLMATPWPTLTVADAPQPPTGGAVTVPVVPFANEVLSDTLRRIERAEDEARLPIDAALEDGTDDAETARLREQVSRIEAQIAGLRHNAFAPVMAAAAKRFAKAEKKGGPEVGWCANPAFFGGCTVPLLDETAWIMVANHKKVQKAARQAR